MLPEIFSEACFLAIIDQLIIIYNSVNQCLIHLPAERSTAATRLDFDAASSRPAVRRQVVALPSDVEAASRVSIADLCEQTTAWLTWTVPASQSRIFQKGCA